MRWFRDRSGIGAPSARGDDGSFPNEENHKVWRLIMFAATRNFLRHAGFSVSRILPSTDPWARRRALMATQRIDLVLDIGAHFGNYGKMLRVGGYGGRILSFEPQPDAFAVLRSSAEKNPPWEIFEMALSDFEGTAEFFVSARTTSSSLHKMSSSAQTMARAETVGTIGVEVRTIDGVLEELQALRGNIYMKCDAQGAEEQILRGAERTVAIAQAVEVELSIADMYEHQWNFRGALDWFAERNFGLYSLEAGFADPKTGKVMQVDAIFYRQQQ